MSQNSLNSLEMRLRDFAKDHDQIRVLGIYGSYAKGSFKETSDIDICIAQKSPLSIDEKIRLTTELSLLLKKEIDLLDLHTATGTILQEALHSSIWIVKESEVFAGMLKKMLLDQADFQPYYQRMLKKKRERFLKK